MRKYIYSFSVFIILLLSSNLNAKDIDICDTTVIFGVINENVHAGRAADDVTSYSGRSLDKGELVIIGGISEHKEYYNENYSKFYQIFYHDKTYYVKAENIDVEDINTYEKIKNMNLEHAERFREYAQQISRFMYMKELSHMLSFIKACKSKGLFICDYSISDNGYATNIDIKVGNPTTKTIKYIWFSFAGYNAVNDPVKGPRGKNLIVKEGIGPIEPDGMASYHFDNAWFNTLVETIEVKQVKVQYMDNSVKMISKPGKIVMCDKDSQLLTKDESEGE